MRPGLYSWNALYQSYHRNRKPLTRPKARCTCIVLGLSCRLCSPSIWLFLASASMADCCCRILLAVVRNELRNLLLNPAPTPPPLPPPATPPPLPPKTRCTPLSAAVTAVALFDLPCCCRCWSAVWSLVDFVAAFIAVSCRRRGRGSICGMLECLAFPTNFGGDRRLFVGSTKVAVTVALAGTVFAAVTVMVAGSMCAAVAISAEVVTAGVDISSRNCSYCSQDERSLLPKAFSALIHCMQLTTAGDRASVILSAVNDAGDHLPTKNINLILS